MPCLPAAGRHICPGQHRVLCGSDRISAKLCNETASMRYFHTNLAQARSNIHIVGEVANPANRIAGQERVIPPYMLNRRDRPCACPAKTEGNHRGGTPTDGDLAVNPLARPVPTTKWMGIWTPARTKDVYPSQV